VATGGTFINKSELVRELCVDRKTLDRRIADGSFPPPHSRVGPRVALWLRKHYQFYVDNRRWPAEAYSRDSGSAIQS
jgi:predicted DNA-binding transcriptional regulator AlpA